MYRPHTSHNSLIFINEGLTLATSALESLCDGQFTLSTQLINLNYFLILHGRSTTVSLETYYFINLFCCFSRYQHQYSNLFTVANSLACERRRISRCVRRLLIHIINPVDKTELSCNTPHQLNAPPQFFLETYPFIYVYFMSILRLAIFNLFFFFTFFHSYTLKLF